MLFKNLNKNIYNDNLNNIKITELLSEKLESNIDINNFKK